MNYRGFMPVARECTFQDFLKCKPHNFSGTEGVIRLTRWFEKIETVFNISNCPPKYQVKYATCTLLDSALTWWNSHKRTIGVDAAYAMKWAGLMKLMTEASSDFHSDASSDSSSRHSLSNHSSPDLPSTFAGPSHKRRRSPMTSVPALPPISRALSPVYGDLIPSPKRVRDFSYLADVEIDPRETSWRDDIMVRGSNEPHLEQDINPEIHAEIDECIACADALRDRGIDARVVVETVDREESETGKRGPVKDCWVESAVTALTRRIAELERDTERLRGTACVESQRVDRLQRDMSRMQRELRQMRQF
uniref:Putative retrotransposon Gag domain-containing protein n=1 Tax=Tanacetum cinerariifolium TaxID=118510 RepID=A0A699LD99_TANCI|nr:putative retrotransposon Gag domain-containing protein [Tanacetum cinerariifolium]